MDEVKTTSMPMIPIVPGNLPLESVVNFPYVTWSDGGIPLTKSPLCHGHTFIETVSRGF